MKTRVAVLCGAKSKEHEVSLVSAYNIVNSMDESKYEVFIVGISKDGIWRQYNKNDFVENIIGGVGDVKLSSNPISGRLAVTQSSNKFYDIENNKVAFECDVIFPAVLGDYAEDGTMQGLIRMMGVPFTTSDTLGSAVAMDKDVSYRLMREAGIPVADFFVLRKEDHITPYNEVIKKVGNDVFFVKPANAGSSVGVSKVETEEEYYRALEDAFKYDYKVIIQSRVIGREIEVAVIGNIGSQRTSDVSGEIVSDGFYSYETKYINANKVKLNIPADVNSETLSKIKSLAIDVCRVHECDGFARVDFFVSDEDVYVIEINTMPGFTKYSMFPALWSESGVNVSEQVDLLIELAIKRYQDKILNISTDASNVIDSIER